MFRLHWCKKRWLGLAVVTLVACSSPNKKAEDPPGANLKETTLVEEGESSQPAFSHSGAKLLFVSGKRAAHNQPQVYEKDLATGVERRVTFQNGATYTPRYHPSDKLIVYASTTDELKEYSPLLNPDSKPSRLPAPLGEPTEVYTHSLGGLEITRLTSRRGFDGQARFSPDGRVITWTQSREIKPKMRTDIMSMDVKTKRVQRLGDIGQNPSQYVISPNGRFSAWIQWSDDFTSTQLMVKRRKEAPSEVAGNILVLKADPVFSPDNEWLLWTQREVETGDFTLWGFDMMTSCVHRWPAPPVEGDRRHPSVSPDSKTLAYTLIQKDRSRIAQIPYTPPSGPCTPSP